MIRAFNLVKRPTRIELLISWVVEIMKSGIGPFDFEDAS